MILFVRHGETAANRARLALGRADPELTDRGHRQVAAVAKVLAEEPIVAVRTSPLQRAVLTGRAIAQHHGIEAHVDERLIELDYGSWDGRSFTELPPDDVARWREDPTFAPPGGESLADVAERVADFCTELVGEEIVVAVSHVSPIKAGALWAMGGPQQLAWRMFLDLASITRVGARDGSAYLASFNETAHLRSLGA
ncbi:MAG TPA: histidine phosphatase family protein [Acidimicrobiia bacterium]